MRYLTRVCLIATALLGILPAQADAASVSIAPDRMLLVDGKRLFVLGLYENPGDDTVLKEVAHAGFNLVRAGDAKSLDRLHALGVYGWVNTGGSIDLGPDAAKPEDGLKKMVVDCGAHPGLLVWEVPDEALWNCWLGALGEAVPWYEQVQSFQRRAAAECKGLLAGYAALKRLEPNHPIWINHASGNSMEDLAAFGRAADIVGCDIYPVLPYPTPVLDISRADLGMVGTCTDRMQRSAPGKPVWMVLQGAGWVDFDGLFGKKNPAGQRPTFAESRFMAYDAIVRGARAVLYWGTHSTDKDSQFWHDLLKLVRELADLQPVLSAPDSEVAPDVRARLILWPMEGQVRALGKNVDGKTWWIVVNEQPFALTYTIRGLTSLEGAAYVDPVAGVQVEVKNGEWSLPIPGYGVQILRPGA